MKPLLPAAYFILCLLCCKQGIAQDIAFMLGNWQGKSYLTADTAQHYQLTLDIDKIKSNRFEGLLKTIKPSDTSLHFDARVLGLVSRKNFDMVRTKVVYVKSSNEKSWQASCTACKPPKWTLTIEVDTFVIRSVVKNCSPDCEWITEFRKPVAAFAEKDKPFVYALTGATYIPEQATVAAATKPDALVMEETPINETISSAKNVAIAPLSENALFPVADPVVQETKASPERMVMHPAGDIMPISKPTQPTSLALVWALPKSTPSIKVKELPVQLPRINMPPAGAIVMRSSQPGSLIYRRTYRSLPRQSPGYHLSKLPLRLPAITTIAAIPSDETTLSATAAVIAASVALPVDYNARKQQVVRAIDVNADSVTIRLYDNGVVDGDIVSVIYNETVVIDKLTLTATTIELKIPVTKSGINQLVFHAHNLGELPPNTAKLEIMYGGRKEELTVSSDLTVSSTINIRHTTATGDAR